MIQKEGWELKTLGDFFDITSSKRVFESEWTSEGVPFYRAREIVKLSINGFVNNDLYISNEMYSNYSDKYGIPKEGDIMVTGVGTLGICYVVNKNDKFYFKDGNIIWLKNKNLINSRFVEYAFKAEYLRTQIDDGIGATVGTYTIIKAKKTKIPVPPLNIQHQIVSELDALSDILNKKKQQLEELDKLAQATFYDMFGDPLNNEKGWKMKTLQETVSIDCPISYGIVQPGEEIKSGLPIVRPVDLVDTYVSIEKLKRINPELANSYKKTTLRGNEILICVRGTTGVMSLSTPELIGCNVTRGLVPLFFDNHDRLFVYHLLKTPQIQQIISEKTYGIALKQINLSELRKIRLILPPVNVQSLFVKKIEAVHNQKKLISKSIDDVQQLFDYTMDKYFN
jgi:type I restriction enzyme, S subunit